MKHSGKLLWLAGFAPERLHVTVLGLMTFWLCSSLPAQARFEGFNTAYAAECLPGFDVRDPSRQSIVEATPMHFASTSFAVDADRVRLSGRAWRIPCVARSTPGVVMQLSYRSEITGKALPLPFIEFFQRGDQIGRVGFERNAAGGGSIIREGIDWAPPFFFSGILMFNGDDTRLLTPRPGRSYDETAALTIQVSANGGQITLQLPAVGAFDVNKPQLPASTPGLWYQPAESGWGIWLDQNPQGVTFATWLTFDAEGRTTWFVMPNGLPVGRNLIEGDVYQPSGPAYSAATFDPQRVRVGAPVGRFRVGAAEDGALMFEARMTGLASDFRKFVVPMSVTDSNGVACDDSSGGWWQPARAGWGFGLQGSAFKRDCGLAFAWATYDEGERPIWFFAGMAPAGPNEMRGMGYQPTGSPYSVPFDPGRFALGSPVAHFAIDNQAARPDDERFRFSYSIGSFGSAIPDVVRFRY